MFANWLQVSSGHQICLKAAAELDFQPLFQDRIKSSFLEGQNGWKPPWASNSHAIRPRIVRAICLAASFLRQPWVERDYQDLKQEFGLGHYEGRNWRGFHYHATLSIAAYGFLMGQRLRMQSVARDKKNFLERALPALPPDYIPRGSPARSTPRS